MIYIENMFSDAGIDAKYDVKRDFETIKGTYQIGSFCITFRYGDEINGFTYNRELCIYDCQNYYLEVIKIIENDISLIKSEIRRLKIKQLGI
jgi:hypothetical protein